MITRHQLNRATLARQFLISRAPVGAAEAVESLAGLQAQDVPPPFIALWSRLDGFARADLAGLCNSGEVVRASLMRHTVHLMTRRDYDRLYGAIRPALERSWSGHVRKRIGSLDVDAVIAAARAFVGERPRRWVEISRHVAALWPEEDERALAYTVRTFLPMTRRPDGGPWGYSGNAEFALPDPWPDEADRARELVLRYLAAFGPATAADATVWSGRSGLRPVFEQLRDELVTFRDESGRELFDLPDAPRPPADTPVPPRLLPVYDNLVLSHRDRTRVVPEEYQPRVQIRLGQLLSPFLVDGFVAGVWTRDRKTGRISLDPFGRLSRENRAALREEADRLEAFLEEE